MTTRNYKIYKAIISSGSYCGDKVNVFVVAENYAEAEQLLESDKNLYWTWNHGRRLILLEEQYEGLILPDK